MRPDSYAALAVKPGREAPDLAGITGPRRVCSRHIKPQTDLFPTIRLSTLPLTGEVRGATRELPSGQCWPSVSRDKYKTSSTSEHEQKQAQQVQGSKASYCPAQRVGGGDCVFGCGRCGKFCSADLAHCSVSTSFLGLPSGGPELSLLHLNSPASGIHRADPGRQGLSDEGE